MKQQSKSIWKKMHYRVQNNDEKSLWWSFKAWNYAQIYLRHSDFSSLFRTLVLTYLHIPHPSQWNCCLSVSSNKQHIKHEYLPNNIPHPAQFLPTWKYKTTIVFKELRAEITYHVLSLFLHFQSKTHCKTAKFCVSFPWNLRSIYFR